MVERKTDNLKAIGSSPILPKAFFKIKGLLCFALLHHFSVKRMDVTVSPWSVWMPKAKHFFAAKQTFVLRRSRKADRRQRQNAKEWLAMLAFCCILDLLQVLEALFSLQLQKLGHAALILKKQLHMSVGLNHLEKLVLHLMLVSIRLEFSFLYLILKQGCSCHGCLVVCPLVTPASLFLQLFREFCYRVLGTNGRKGHWTGLQPYFFIYFIFF